MKIRFGAFEAYPQRNLIVGPEGQQTIEPKMMRVLLLLIEKQGEVVSREEILQRVWPDTFVGDEVVYRSISELRKVLGDEPNNPEYLETVPRQGYRWLVAPGDESQAAPSVPNGPVLRWALWKRILVSVCVLLLVAASVWLFSLREENPGSDGQAPVWVLIVQAEGNAEEEYGGLLRHGLEVALGQSARIRLVAPERILDGLRLMRLDADTLVTVELGREICIRDGEIDVLVAAGLDRNQEEFLLRVLLMDPASGDLLAAHRQEASESEVVGAIQSLADAVRVSLGEVVQAGESETADLEKATTRSLEALRLYSEAMRLGYRWQWEPAERLLRRAIEEDPDFASANIMLAWGIRNQMHPLERLARLDEYSEPAERALELSRTLPDAERLWIEGSYYHLLGDTDRSVAPYQALVSLHPDHLWATHNLAVHFRTRVHHTDWNGTIEFAKTYLEAKANLRPTDSWENLFVVEFLTFRLGRSEESEPFLSRARKLLSAEGREGSLWVRLYPEILQLAEQEDPASLLAAVKRLRPQLSGPEAVELADFLLGMGRLAETRDLYALDPESRGRQRREAYLMYVTEQSKGLRDALSDWASDPDNLEQVRPLWVALLARAGLVEEAEAALDRIPPSPYSSLDHNEVARGAVLLAAGDFEGGRQLVERALECPLSDEVYLVAADLLAEAWETRGFRDEGIQLLERILQRQYYAGFGATTRWPLWFRLLRLYEESGAEEKRNELARKIRRLLRAADEDHPLLQATRFAADS